MVKINTVEELLDFVISRNTLTGINFKLGDNFNYRYRISGQAWSGLVDIKIARIVKSLHDQIAFLHSLAYNVSITTSKYNVENYMPVEVQLSQGSALPEIAKEYFEKVLEKLFIGIEKLSEPERAKIYKLIVVLSISGLILYFPVPKIIETINKPSLTRELEIIKNDNEARTVNNIKEIIQLVQRPNLVISKQLNKEDILTNLTTGEVITQSEAVRRFKIDKEEIITTHHIDGSYFIKDVATNIGSAKYEGVLISFDNYNVWVVLDLSKTDREKLLNAFNNKLKIDLLVNCDFKNKAPYQGTAFGIGKPRDDAKTITQIIDNQ